MPGPFTNHATIGTSEGTACSASGERVRVRDRLVLFPGVAFRLSPGLWRRSLSPRTEPASVRVRDRLVYVPSALSTPHSCRFVGGASSVEPKSRSDKIEQNRTISHFVRFRPRCTNDLRRCLCRSFDFWKTWSFSGAWAWRFSGPRPSSLDSRQIAHSHPFHGREIQNEKK
jgi:hypothetical protein